MALTKAEWVYYAGVTLLGFGGAAAAHLVPEWAVPLKMAAGIAAAAVMLFWLMPVFIRWVGRCCGRSPEVLIPKGGHVPKPTGKFHLSFTDTPTQGGVFSAPRPTDDTKSQQGSLFKVPYTPESARIIANNGGGSTHSVPVYGGGAAVLLSEETPAKERDADLEQVAEHYGVNLEPSLTAGSGGSNKTKRSLAGAFSNAGGGGSGGD